jgi:hypothetical protein
VEPAAAGERLKACETNVLPILAANAGPEQLVAPFGLAQRFAGTGDGGIRRKLPLPLGEGGGEGIVNRLQQTIYIVQDIAIPEPQHANSLRFEERRTLLIMRTSIGSVVLAAVKFNRESRLVAIEIKDVGFNGVLPPELEPCQAPVA